MVRVSLPSSPVTTTCVTPEKATAGPPLMLYAPLSVALAVMTMVSSAAVPVIVKVVIADLPGGYTDTVGRSLQVTRARQ